MTVNRIPNPSGEIVPTPTSWSVSTAGDPASTVVRTAAWARAGSYASRYTATRDDAATILSRLGVGLANSIVVEPGEEIAFRHTVVPRAGSRDLRARIYWYRADGTASAISSAAQGVNINTPPLNEELDLFVADVVPDDAVRAGPATYIVGGGVPIPNELIQVDQDAWILTRNPPGTFSAFGHQTKAAEMPIYFDGDTPGAEWLGVPHASESRYPAEVAEVLEPGNEVFVGRRAWPRAQALLASAPVENLGFASVGWHGTETDENAGAFAVARIGGPFEPFVGEVLSVAIGARTIYVYLVGARDVPTDLSLARRAFAALGGLYRSTLDVNVEVAA